jgi:peptidoglycan/LPS O-acetylase OafA/YrhL
MVVLAGAIYSERQGRLTIIPVFALLGGASYSIYILHYDFLILCAKISTVLGLASSKVINFAFLLVSIFAIIVGLIYHKTVELPLTSHAKNWLNRILSSLISVLAGTKSSFKLLNKKL